MYYILYDLKTLKVVHKDTKPLKPQNMSVFGIAEYKGEIPKNNWLTVDNIHEKIETYKGTEIVENYDDNGSLVTKEVEVEKIVVDYTGVETQVTAGPASFTTLHGCQAGTDIG